MNGEILQAFNLFVAGSGHAGTASSVTLPKLMLKVEDYQGGGYDSPIEVDMGLEKLEASFKLTSFNPSITKLFAKTGQNAPMLLFKGSVQNTVAGTEVPLEVKMQGVIKEVDLGETATKAKTEISYSLVCTYYKYIYDGKDVVEIDVPNMKRIIDGVDQLQARRVNLGVS